MIKIETILHRLKKLPTRNAVFNNHQSTVVSVVKTDHVAKLINQIENSLLKEAK